MKKIKTIILLLLLTVISISMYSFESSAARATGKGTNTKFHRVEDVVIYSGYDYYPFYLISVTRKFTTA